MVKGITVKASLCASALILSLSINSIRTTAETGINIAETGIAGISAILDSYYEATTDKETGSADQYMEKLTKEEDTDTEEVTKVKSPYENLGISIANDFVNIRSKANTDSEVVGKLYRGCATDILEKDGDWVKIHSGNVDGYIKAEYLAIGTEAEALVDEFATKYATVINTPTLRVRQKKSTDSETTTLIPEGESYYIIKEYKDWVKIQIDDGQSDSESGGGETGYISKDYIKIDVKFQYAISIEEEKAKLAAEEAAKEAEKERLQQLAIDQEQERQAAEDKKEAAQQSTQQSQSQSDVKEDNNDSSSSSSSSSSSTGQAIANYAVKFIGNPYVWGGTSLTGGTDCSGFVQSIYANFGRGIARTSRDQSSSAGVEVSISDRQPGDLIFYCNSSGTVNHVAMYIGNNQVVHASNPRDGIKISSYNYRTPYKIRRIAK
jgi:cell wall-associated NlpC family hydrolase/SH3-like domain-containing protein